MEKNDKLILIFYVLLGLGIIFGLYTIDSSLEKPSGSLNLAPIPLSNISITKYPKKIKYSLYLLLQIYHEIL